MKVKDISQGNGGWLEWRRNGIGSSDAPVILGVSPYKTYRELFFEKKGINLVEQTDKEFIFQMGHKFERIAREFLHKQSGYEIGPVCCESDFSPRIIASLDGFHQNVGVVEIKLVGKEKLEKASRQKIIPQDHYCQIQHQLMVTGHDTAYWVGGVKEGDYHIEKIERNQPFIDDLLDRELLFLANLDENIEPPLGPDDFLVPSDLSLLNDLWAAKRVLDAAKENFDMLKELTVNTYKHNRIAGDGIKIVRTNRSGSIDYARLPEVKALTKEYLEEFRKKGLEVWTVTIKE